MHTLAEFKSWLNNPDEDIAAKDKDACIVRFATSTAEYEVLSVYRVNNTIWIDLQTKRGKK